MQLVARLRRERALVEDDQRPLRYGRERQADQCFAVVRIGRIPYEGEVQAVGRLDDAEVAAQVEDVSFGRLHGDPVSAGDIQVERSTADVKPEGPHHAASDSASTHARKTRSGDALTSRSRWSSRPGIPSIRRIARCKQLS